MAIIEDKNTGSPGLAEGNKASARSIKGPLALLGAALVWGFAFAFQVEGMDHVPPVTFMAARCLLATIFLAVLLIILRGPKKAFRFSKDTIKGGIGCGLFMTLANDLQQIGIQYTTAGKAGFLTAMYMLFVPIFGVILLKRREGLKTWIAVLIGAVGMYFLSIKENFTLAPGDGFEIACAVVFAGHILCADHFAPKSDAVQMSFLQFAVACVISWIWAGLAEDPTLEGLWAARVSIAYVGVMSAGVGYTLQLIGQQRTRPEAASLLMSLESVFAVLAGWIMLGERMSPREILGCVLMFAAIVIVQLRSPEKAPK